MMEYLLTLGVESETASEMMAGVHKGRAEVLWDPSNSSPKATRQQEKIFLQRPTEKRLFRRYKEIGAEHVRFHDMRHTFATLSLKSGVDVRTLSETLGHFSAGFTLSTYVHSTPGMKQSAADAIGNTIRNAI